LRVSARNHIFERIGHMGTVEKPLSEAIKHRRATPSFDGTPVPEEDLKKILQAGLEAPSGYNLQPWRFVVVRDPEARKGLRAAAMGQPKVEEAPVVIVACGDPDGWKSGDMEEMMRLAEVDEGTRTVIRQNLNNFLGAEAGDKGGVTPHFGVWVNRHTMIALTTMMWTAETLGYDTAPMEGFSETAVRQTLGIPDRVRVVALLAIGHLKGSDKPYGKRFAMDRIVFNNKWGNGLKL
jgi:nitroreductase